MNAFFVLFQVKEKDDVRIQSLTDRLRIYEIRALNLFRDVNLGHIDGIHLVSKNSAKSKARLVKLSEEDLSDLELSDI